MDETAARDAFETALRTHRPDFETFFLARLFELEIRYSEEACVVEFPARAAVFSKQRASFLRI